MPSTGDGFFWSHFNEATVLNKREDKIFPGPALLQYTAFQILAKCVSVLSKVLLCLFCWRYFFVRMTLSCSTSHKRFFVPSENEDFQEDQIRIAIRSIVKLMKLRADFHFPTATASLNSLVV